MTPENPALTRLKAWIKSDRHLPVWLRDFHDQKRVFLAIRRYRPVLDSDHSEIPWRVGHIYVIDAFLKFMAMHGWTLRRTRVESCDLEATLTELDKEELAELKMLLDARKAAKDATTTKG